MHLHLLKTNSLKLPNEHDKQLFSFPPLQLKLKNKIKIN